MRTFSRINQIRQPTQSGIRIRTSNPRYGGLASGINILSPSQRS